MPSSTQFPSGSITMTNMYSAYNTYSFSGLREKTYYDSNGTAYTVPSTGINLGTFLGKYYGETTGSIDKREARSDSGGTLFHTVTAGVGFKNGSYIIHGTTLVSLTLQFYLYSPSGDGTNSPNFYVYVDGSQIIATGSGDEVTYTISGANTLSIQVTGNARGYSSHSGANGSFNYTISTGGLQYTGFANNNGGTYQQF